MNYADSILSLIGETPLVRLRLLSDKVRALALGKLESFNPGHSVKDRIALKMVVDAEKSGKLKPGGRIIEATSGNTGMGLALVAAVRGYACIFTISDKQSPEKIAMLRALGAEVVICPADVPHEDPRSYCSVAQQLSKKYPDAFFPYQYDNLSNMDTHYLHTGPELWRQTQGRITHYVAGIGTGGSICGTSKYLKEQNPQIKTIGIDAEGSIFKRYKETGSYDEADIDTYKVEGIGSDFVPKNVQMEYIDEVVDVSDEDAAWMARHVARTEGLFVGWSCGAVILGALRYGQNKLNKKNTMVLLLPDHGSRYARKIYADEWMKKQGYHNPIQL